MQLVWTKCGRDWFGIWGKYRADVRGASGPLGFCCWSVYTSDRRWGSGGTSFIKQSKRAAELEIERIIAKTRENVT